MADAGVTVLGLSEPVGRDVHRQVDVLRTQSTLEAWPLGREVQGRSGGRGITVSKGRKGHSRVRRLPAGWGVGATPSVQPGV